MPNARQWTLFWSTVAGMTASGAGASMSGPSAVGLIFLVGLIVFPLVFLYDIGRNP